MTNAIIDQNHVTSKLAVLNTDGTTIVRIKCAESTGAIDFYIRWMPLIPNSYVTSI